MACFNANKCLYDVLYLYEISTDFSKVSLKELFTLDANSKGTRVIHANWLRPGALGILPMYFLSNKVINRRNLLDQRTVDAPCINAFVSRLV